MSEVVLGEGESLFAVPRARVLVRGSRAYFSKYEAVPLLEIIALLANMYVNGYRALFTSATSPRLLLAATAGPERRVYVSREVLRLAQRYGMIVVRARVEGEFVEGRIL